jgi:hypothetical protein
MPIHDSEGLARKRRQRERLADYWTLAAILV